MYIHACEMIDWVTHSLICWCQSILGGFSWISFLGWMDQWINPSPCDSQRWESSWNQEIMGLSWWLQVKCNVQRCPKGSCEPNDFQPLFSPPALQLGIWPCHWHRISTEWIVQTFQLERRSALDPGRCWETVTRRRTPNSHDSLNFSPPLPDSQIVKMSGTGGLQVDSRLDVAKLAIRRQNSRANSVK